MISLSLLSKRRSSRRTRHGRSIRHWSPFFAPLVLGLVLALDSPTQSQTPGETLDQIAAATRPSDRNWHAFWQHHLGEWKGRWTRYAPSGEIEDTFLSTRSFTANPTRTEVVQVNRYNYASGRSLKKEWRYTLKDHSRADGLTHPAYAAMRGLAFNNGAAALLIPTLHTNKFAPFEFFLKHGDFRYSVALLYGQDGQLIRTSSIREERGQPIDALWTDNVVQMKPWHPKGVWQGSQQQINPDLTQHPVEPTNWQWRSTNQSTHYFPDRIILRCPQRFVQGQSFSINVLWQVNTKELQTISASYNEQRQLISVMHQSLSPDP